MTTSILWWRRDLRLADLPSLLAACDAADRVVPLFVLDDRLRGPSGAPRLAFLYRCLRELEERTGGALRVQHGAPEQVLPQLVQQTGATSVHISSDAGPYGRQRDERVARALGEVPLVASGSPYAVTPGTLVGAGGQPFRVYTPFARAWRARGVHSPAGEPREVAWTDGGQPSEGVPPDPDLGPVVLPPAGELAGTARWQDYRQARLSSYAGTRDAPAAEGTTSMSVYLKYGCLHPRTLLADLGPGDDSLRGELAWRDFYADVLWHRPESARVELQPAMARLEYDEGPLADERFAAWAAGRTGFPLVDAGMRELLGSAWMHNRVRMVVGSFLCKDLHLPWQRGARHFMAHLRDGDLASNSQGWQWVAGTGTDPSPYFRVFNPVKQGREHDPDGDYVRRWVPELRGVAGASVHEPWKLPGGPPNGYPAPIVDHAAERAESLRRYAEVRQARPAPAGPG